MTASLRPVLLAAVSLLFAPAAGAQAIPGNPVGSQTGDSMGAYTGLATAPDTNLFTGVAQTSIPIEVPPGRLGLAPVLALAYSSSGGPSEYGYGWSLPLPRIHRSTRHGVPRYDQTDGFVLEMPGATVELERVPGSSRGFRARIESAFLRVGFHEGDNRWKVVDKLGATFQFGLSAATRTGRGASRDETFSWLLESIEDPAGNRIDFTYRAGGPAGTSTGLPDRIRYGANSRTGAPHFADVAFAWTPLVHGNPPVVSWREGHANTLDVRLAAIETSTRGLRARRYDFSHEEDEVTADLRLVGATLTAFADNPADDVRLPSTVFVYAPSMATGWPASGSETSLGDSFEVPEGGILRYEKTNITTDSVDVNGDGVIDRIGTTTSRSALVKLGNRRGFEATRAWNWPSSSSAPRSIRRSDSNGNLLINVFDLDGDSFADLVDSNAAACSAPSGNWCVWRGSADGFASTPSRWKSPIPLLRSTAGDGARVLSDLVDIDADGRLDLLDASVFDAGTGATYWRLYRNNGSGFDTIALRFEAPVPWLSRSVGGRLVYGLFDINADSLPDLVAADTTTTSSTPRWTGTLEWKVYFNRGDGLAQTPASWPIERGTDSPTGLPNFLNLHAEDGSTIADLFDITGDGRPDLVRRLRLGDNLVGVPDRCDYEPDCPFPDENDSAIAKGSCCYNILVFANTGSSFAEATTWSSPTHGLRSSRTTCPSGDDIYCQTSLLYDFDFFDFDGDGLVEFVERYTAGWKPFHWLVHPHPFGAAGGGTRPNLLLAMRNGVGGETMLRYDVAASTPDTRLPFPHWIVRERELRDSVYDATPLRTSFAYRGGHFDALEREMRGFSLVQEVDPVGTVRVREYHQDRRRAGRLRRTTNLAPPPCVAGNPEDPTDPCSPWKFPLGSVDYDWPADGPVLLRSETDVPMHGGTPVENLRRTTRYDYDAYGNVARRRTETPLAPATTTTTEYVHLVADRSGGMPDVYLVAKPSHAKTDEDGHVSPLVERAFHYQSNGPVRGLLAKSSTCTTWEGSECAHWSERTFAYDTLGNMSVARGPAGEVSRTDYDSDGVFAVRAIDPVGLITTSTTDARTGRVVETVSPNGNRLRSRYDGLGRLLRTWGPGTRENNPLRRLQYAPGSLGGSPPRVTTTDAGSGTATSFFDGLGRSVANKKESMDADRQVAVVSGLRRYDARGLVVAEALPFDSDDLDVRRLNEAFEDAPAWLEFRHDSSGRRTETIAPDGTSIRVDPSAPGILRTDDANITSRSGPGSVTLEIFDGLGRLILRDMCSAAPAATAPYECPAGTLARRESWIHDGLGRPRELRTSALGAAAGDSITRIARDGLGGRIEVFHSNAGTWRFRNDDSGRLVEVTKPDGSQLRTTYDAVGRIARRRGPTSTTSYRYQSAGGGIGKIRRMVTRTRSARFLEDTGYDDRGRVSSRYRRLSPRRQNGARLKTEYLYDDLDRRIATRYVDWDAEGEETLYTAYDAFGRQVSMWNDNLRYVEHTQYDSAGRRVRIDYGNGISDLASFEERDNAARTAGYLRCTRTTATAAAHEGACATSILDLESRRYASYDNAGNLLSVTDALYADSDPRHENLRYQYDALGRLSVAGTPAAERQQFAFDPLGNLTRNGSLWLAFDDPEHPSRVTTMRDAAGNVSTFSFDANGRRTADGERRFTYDDYDRLASVAFGDEVVSEYGYLDTGERVLRHDPATSEVELELGDGVRVDGSEVERTIVFAGKVVAVERHSITPELLPGSSSPRDIPSGVARVFLHHDTQESVRVVTGETGEALEYHRYRAFGQHRRKLDGDGRPIEEPATRFAYSGHIEEADVALQFFGARYYDPRTASFLTLDPRMQFASPYAYSAGNPVAGRDADGSIFGLTAIELLALAVGTATFVDSLASTGDLGHSLTAGVFAGFSVFASSQLSTAIARPLAQAGHPYLQMAASVASDGFQAISAVEAIEDGRYAGGIVAAGMLAASLIGIESAGDLGPGSNPAEQYSRHGIEDRGVIDGKRVIDVNGICATRPGCLTNTLIAARENIRLLFGANVACVGGCEHVVSITEAALTGDNHVLLRCNSFGSIKCLGAIDQGLARHLQTSSRQLTVEMSGTPLLRPPIREGLTYQVNLFDPVVWVGTGYSAPLRSDVVLGRNWWVPAPLIVHHSRMYELPFHQAAGDMLP